MEEIIIKVDIPVELKKKFESALALVVKQFVRRLRFSMINEAMSKSELTDEQIKDLSDKLKERLSKRHGL